MHPTFPSLSFHEEEVSSIEDTRGKELMISNKNKYLKEIRKNGRYTQEPLFNDQKSVTIDSKSKESIRPARTVLKKHESIKKKKKPKQIDHKK